MRSAVRAGVPLAPATDDSFEVGTRVLATPGDLERHRGLARADLVTDLFRSPFPAPLAGPTTFEPVGFDGAGDGYFRGVPVDRAVPDRTGRT